MVRLRPFETRDIDIVVPIEQELFPDDPPWSADTFASELAHVPATRWYVVAVDNAKDDAGGDVVVGYAGLMHSGQVGDPADVQTIAVARQRQRRGIGSVLMRALLDEADRRRAAEVMLDVRADNVAAQAFYHGFGFTEVRRRRRYFGDGVDGVVMALRL